MIARLCKQALLLAALALIPAFVSGAIQLRANPQKPLQPGEIRAATVRQWGPQVLFVDARPIERFEAGHIPTAVRLTAREWDALVPKFLDAWEPDKVVVVYCEGGTCDTSREIAERIKKELQIQTVYYLQGGYPAWRQK
ncbi:MAG TPA: rhodanese-like domain-containing protein [Chthoniobacteraceae bacterium]|nr:rhodanese-like domain-containing protein [Chthoniobacteraceae bacterium]